MFCVKTPTFLLHFPFWRWYRWLGFIFILKEILALSDMFESPLYLNLYRCLSLLSVFLQHCGCEKSEISPLVYICLPVWVWSYLRTLTMLAVCVLIEKKVCFGFGLSRTSSKNKNQPKGHTIINYWTLYIVVCHNTLLNRIDFCRNVTQILSWKREVHLHVRVFWWDVSIHRVCFLVFVSLFLLLLCTFHFISKGYC